MKVHVFLYVCAVSSLVKIILMPKIRFAIFMLSNIISFVIGDAMIFSNVLEDTSQAFFLVAVGLNVDLVAGLCARVTALLPTQDLVMSLLKNYSYFFILSRRCC